MGTRTTPFPFAVAGREITGAAPAIPLCSESGGRLPLLADQSWIGGRGASCGSFKKCLVPIMESHNMGILPKMLPSITRKCGSCSKYFQEHFIPQGPSSLRSPKMPASATPVCPIGRGPVLLSMTEAQGFWP